MSQPLEDEEEDIMTKIINQITLECLINKSQYEKYLTNNIQQIKISTKKDKKFYRKRILQMGRDILLNTPPLTITNDVLFAFENFAKTCIQNFKIVDKMDIIQSEHIAAVQNLDVDLIDSSLNEIIDCGTTELADQAMLRQIKPPQITLDKFVKVTMTKQDARIIPLQKEINLKEPSLRIKGVVQSIRKKKNIDLNYETTTQETTTQETNTQETHP
jgi:hypothetical protein